VAKLLAAEPSP
jgi:hypothetical protein